MHSDDPVRGASLRDALALTAARLAEAGVPDPVVDAELLVGHVLGLSRGELQARVILGGELSGEEAATLSALVVRRAAREPLQHLTGTAPFRAFELAVGPGVFTPRPETEQVVQLAIDFLRNVPTAEPRAVDLGSGSGAIAIAMAREVPRARVWAYENSPEAFAWTKRNVEALTDGNLELVFGDLADALPAETDSLDVVISNPPYIPRAAVPRDPEVRLHDPAHALYGGEDGLDVVRVVSGVGLRLLRSGGMLVLEHGEEQSASIRALLEADGWHAVAHHRDLTGRDRATTALR
ncbi:peptide chain release factor N(5)-glutamine methyltransferase [Agromyces seonyuensis]|uniref:Release factor glutamine methyltransferase n=1 Tax=Agromyces seonyuensis TaxID=2662446 RepID=A0A6I4NYF1_9MICO|nr:peptide chain release factor N(5)-glutamine methyltransferase [Agromyces seonyuensis]